MTERLSILPEVMHGVASFSGYRGIGKSWLASQSDLPDNIDFIDFEDKGEGIHEQLTFGRYVPLTQIAENHVHLFSMFEREVYELPQDRYTVMVLDNISVLEQAIAAQVMTQPAHYAQRYGLNENNIRTGKFGGARSVVNYMISEFMSVVHSKGVKLVVITSHISPKWSPAGPIPNKYNVKGADRWQELSILTLLLVPGKSPPIPDALVQKEQLGIISIPPNLTPKDIELMRSGEYGHVMKRRLPPKISECTFQKIRWYLTNPVDFNNLTEDEKPREDEIDPFRDRLSKEQFEYMRKSLEIQEREQQQEEELLNAIEQNKNLEELQTIANQIDLFSEQPDFVFAPPVLQMRLSQAGLDCELSEVVQAMTLWKKQNQE